MTPQAELLLPPKDLIYRVAGNRDPDWFVSSGRRSVKDIQRALSLVGRDFSTFQHILDFGVGCGRILLQLRYAVPMPAVTGVDIDAEAVGWLRTRIPDAKLMVINELPPMPIAAQSIDLVYCHSVFTHLDADYQDRWLEELARVTMPGAILVVSFSGQTAFGKVEELWRNANADPTPLRQQLADSGFLYVADDQWKDGPFPDFYHSAFHSLAYVQEHWGKYFKILNHIPSGSLGVQDFIVMENPGSAAPVPGSSGRLENPSGIPMPPPTMRAKVGDSNGASYDNPDGGLLFPEVPERFYVSVFDFGSGCGRQARQLMQQKVRPKRYVGIELDRKMVAWCQANLSPIDPHFHFLHDGVFSTGAAAGNERRSMAPFPVGSGEFTIVNTNSVFTNLYEDYAEFYLREIERILTSDGIARTTWFFFDRAGFPRLEPWQHCLCVNPRDAASSVMYDPEWFLAAIHAAGLVVRETLLPSLPGYQWQVLLERRREGSVNRFPAEESASEWLCGPGASHRENYLREIDRQRAVKQDLESQITALRSANLNLQTEVDGLRNSWSWRLTGVGRKFAGLILDR